MYDKPFLYTYTFYICRFSTEILRIISLQYCSLKWSSFGFKVFASIIRALFAGLLTFPLYLMIKTNFLHKKRDESRLIRVLSIIAYFPLLQSLKYFVIIK